MLDGLAKDLRYAYRQFRDHPGFLVVTILVLALGIGANATVFSIINAVLLCPLPFPNAAQLVQIWESNPSRGRIQEVVSPYKFVDWRAQSASMAEMAEDALRTIFYRHPDFIADKSRRLAFAALAQNEYRGILERRVDLLLPEIPRFYRIDV